MKKGTSGGASQGSLYFFHTLVLLAIILTVLIITGSIYSVVRPPNAKPLFRLGNPHAAAEIQPDAQNNGIDVFSGIGRLRIPLSDSSTLIISIAFPYSSNDMVFTEELAAKIGDFKVIAGDYFSSLPADKLTNLDENAAKQEILKQYNKILRLGRIEALYFSDLIILD